MGGGGERERGRGRGRGLRRKSLFAISTVRRTNVLPEFDGPEVSELSDPMSDPVECVDLSALT